MKKSISEQIVAVRVAAGGSSDGCPTCCRPASAPYRRHDAAGHIVEGCVDAVHEQHMVGATGTVAWHFRPVAVEMRKRELGDLLVVSGKRRAA